MKEETSASRINEWYLQPKGEQSPRAEAGSCAGKSAAHGTFSLVFSLFTPPKPGLHCQDSNGIIRDYELGWLVFLLALCFFSLSLSLSSSAPCSAISLCLLFPLFSGNAVKTREISRLQDCTVEQQIALFSYFFPEWKRTDRWTTGLRVKHRMKIRFWWTEQARGWLDASFSRGRSDFYLTEKWYLKKCLRYCSCQLKHSAVKQTTVSINPYWLPASLRALLKICLTRIAQNVTWFTWRETDRGRWRSRVLWQCVAGFGWEKWAQPLVHMGEGMWSADQRMK